MRRVALILIVSLMASVPLLAQRGGMRGGGGGGMRGGGGGGMRGGGGMMRGGGFGGGFGTGGMRFGGGFGTFRGGFGAFRNGSFRQPFRGNFFFRRFPGFGFSPFGFPAFSGGLGFYDSSFYGSYPDSYGYPYATSPYGGPEVVIVQDSSGGYPAAPQSEGYAPPPAPVIREYVAPSPPQGAYETPLYLIAFQDGVIRAVLAYWVEGATMHYVSMDHEQKQAPLASIDRALSERLNRERNVTFRLPH